MKLEQSIGPLKSLADAYAAHELRVTELFSRLMLPGGANFIEGNIECLIESNAADPTN